MSVDLEAFARQVVASWSVRMPNGRTRSLKYVYEVSVSYLDA